MLRNIGPAVAGMPEADAIPIPKYLAQQGIRDMGRISDRRMSGTAYGTIVLHVTREAARGGPLALVRNGDLIRLDIPGKCLDLLVEPTALDARRNYRFDTADGSVVFSGDTMVNDDLIALAQGPTSWCTTWRTCRVGWRLRCHFGRDVEGRDDLSGRGRGDDRTLEGAVGLHDDLAGAVHVPPQVVVEHRGQAPSLEQFTVV
jgi:Dehydratase family